MDTKEFERLIELFLDCIYRVDYSGCRNYADTEDVVQNTFLLNDAPFLASHSTHCTVRCRSFCLYEGIVDGYCI